MQGIDLIFDDLFKRDNTKNWSTSPGWDIVGVVPSTSFFFT